MLNGSVMAMCFVLCAFLGWNFTVFSDILKELKRIADALEKHNGTSSTE